MNCFLKSIPSDVCLASGLCYSYIKGCFECLSVHNPLLGVLFDSVVALLVLFGSVARPCA